MLIDDWITMYEKAWRTEGTTLLSDIFTDDVSYKTSPFAEPISGLQALATFWEEGRDGPNEQFEMSHEIVAIEGDRAVVRLDVHYADSDERWKDIWILNFDTGGRCSAFEEWPLKPEPQNTQD
jgi:hypothetical protein